nr:replication protein A 70 kDa DNA-binding subunit B [Tanacetum cinerariifolium]
MSLTLWNDKVQAVVDRSAYQLCDKYAKGEQNDQLPIKITALIGKKYAFKVSIDEYNVKKLLPVFTVLRLSDDPEILASIRLAMDTEATSSHFLTSLCCDENKTPVSAEKNDVVNHVEQKHASDGKNKRVAEKDIGNESANGKKKPIEVNIEKDEWLETKNECGQEEVEKRALVTSDMKPIVNNEKPGEYYNEIEAKEQKRWKLESEREARLEAARK